ncbi:MAG: hypothetical protein V2A74_08465 [bacterium]
MFRWRQLLLSLFLTAILAAPAAANPVTGYLRDRCLDFLDIFRVKVDAGANVGAYAKATAIAQLGAVYTEGGTAGLERRAIGNWYENRLQYGISMAEVDEIETGFNNGNEFADPDSAWSKRVDPKIVRNGVFYGDDGRDRFFAISAEVHLGLGVDVAIYPEELFDFIVGIFGVDIFYEDDVSPDEGDPFWNY